MNILALETSGWEVSLAALDGDRLLAQEQLEPERRTAQFLAPAIDTLLGGVDWTPHSVDLVAVSIGPGSFTGLRVGVTTAKAFAYAAGCDVSGIATPEVIAEQAPVEAPCVAAVLDAQRGQLYSQQYRRGPEGLQAERPVAIYDFEPWLAELPDDAWISGPGLVKLADRLPSDRRVLDSSLWTPRAETVGKLAWRRAQGGQRDDLWKLAPNYVRRSAAEEKRDSAEPSSPPNDS